MREFEGFTKNSRTGWRPNRVLYLAATFWVIAGIGFFVFFTPFSGDGEQLAEGAGGEAMGLFEMLGNVSDDPQNILVMGVDRRAEVEGTRTDTMMLVRVYPETGELRLVSIPRDLFVEVKPGVRDKINAAYSYDGVSGSIGAVENFSNVYIDHYAVVDFEGFEEIVDTLGGVQIDLEEGEVPSKWKVKDEAQNLNGRRTLMYARYRSTSGGDIDRIRRQQEVLAAVRSKALRPRSMERFPRITRAVFRNVETDMSLVELASLGKIMAEHGRNGLMTYTQLKGTPDTLDDGAEVLVPDEAGNEYILREFRD